MSENSSLSWHQAAADPSHSWAAGGYCRCCKTHMLNLIARAACMPIAAPPVIDWFALNRPDWRVT